jgi:two-component system, chemotaxis family, response regulator Rcp1
MQEAFRDANSLFRLHVAADGVEAVAILKQWRDYADTTLPDLILLDLNLPKMDGLEVLAQIKNDSELKAIPTVILSISDSDMEIQEAYRRKANCYLRKTMDLEAFETLVERINEFWLTKVTLPPLARAA